MVRLSFYVVSLKSTCLSWEINGRDEKSCIWPIIRVFSSFTQFAVRRILNDYSKWFFSVEDYKEWSSYWCITLTIRIDWGSTVAAVNTWQPNTRALLYATCSIGMFNITLRYTHEHAEELQLCLYANVCSLFILPQLYKYYCVDPTLSERGKARS